MAGGDKAVETFDRFGQIHRHRRRFDGQCANGGGPVDPFRRLTSRSERLQTILSPVLRVEDQITRHIDRAVAPDVELPQLGGYFTERGFIGEAFAGRFTMMQWG